MDIYFLDNGFQARYVLDNFSSLIWTKRYFTYGDFELYTSATPEITAALAAYPYIARDDDDSVMIVENVKISTDAENGDYYTITGRSLESVLTRRIVWAQTTIDVDDPAEGIYQLLAENVTDPEISARKIDDFTVDTSFVWTGELQTQFTGTQLDEAITAICKGNGFGWKITAENGGMMFSLYAASATDVTFSPEFDNLITSTYYRNGEKYKTVAVVAGEGEGAARRRNVVDAAPSATGIHRREVYVDARDISSNNGEIGDTDYMALLAARGEQKLIEEHSETHGFEGEIDPSGTYKYKTDYNLGDIVTVSNGYGVTDTPRIVEIIECWDDTGYKVVPTFEKWEV